MAFKDRNFMTPSILSEEYDGGLFVEYSTGRGIDNQYIYGVTIGVRGYVDSEGFHKQIYDLCKGGFCSLEEAQSYVKSLRNPCT